MAITDLGDKQTQSLNIHFFIKLPIPLKAEKDDEKVDLLMF